MARERRCAHKPATNRRFVTSRQKPNREKSIEILAQGLMRHVVWIVARKKGNRTEGYTIGRGRENGRVKTLLLVAFVIV